MAMGFNISDSIKLIKNFKTTGTITPSSKVLIGHMVAVDFTKARCIVELGPGNGCITNELLGRMQADSKLICLEIDEEFATRLGRINDSRLQVHRACATTLRTILEAQHIACADYVVSSLPLAMIDDDKVDNILHTVRDCLCPQGRYLQYQYSLTQYGDLKAVFGKVRLQFTMRNMPPAFVYRCSR
ncbi:MAG: class I SAM-dependent methyltransferase [Pseudohongiellaceae bacterium]